MYEINTMHMPAVLLLLILPNSGWMQYQYNIPIMNPIVMSSG